MIVFNTTFHAHNDSADRFVGWLRSEYVPQAVSDGRLTDPRLTIVLNAEESDGKNYSLQFRVSDLDTLEAWYAEVGSKLLGAMSATFGHHAAGFSTLLEELEL